jgi:hypothetical protein
MKEAIINEQKIKEMSKDIWHLSKRVDMLEKELANLTLNSKLDKGGNPPVPPSRIGAPIFYC